MHLFKCSFCIFVFLVCPPVYLPANAQPTATALSRAVDSAWLRSTYAQTLVARRNELSIARSAAGAWIAQTPVLGVTERSDRFTNRNGRRELEIALSAPIWLPAQRVAREQLVQAHEQDLEAQLTQARLTVAGLVRERIWPVALARANLVEAQAQLASLETLNNEVLRRVTSGDLARADGMLSEQEVLLARIQVWNLRGLLQESLMQFTALTGLPDLPVVINETVDTKSSITPESVFQRHPKLLAARATADRLKAEFNVLKLTRTDSPVLGVSISRERESANPSSSRMLGLSVQVPLGQNLRANANEAAVQTQIETAMTELEQLKVNVSSELTTARQQIELIQENADLAATRLRLMNEREQLINNAFRLGERGLAEVLRAGALRREAQTAQQQLQIALGQAYARFNQALGVTP